MGGVSEDIGSESSTNLQDSGVAAGINFMDDVRLMARNPISGPFRVVFNRLMQRGFSDAEAEAVGLAAMDPSRTREMIDLMRSRGMSQREARNTVRAIRHLATQNAAATSAQSQ